MRPGISRRIVSGFAAQLAGTVGLVAERFGLAALFIAVFGVAGYESWLQTAAWCGLLSVFSFGLNSWCGNRVQEAWGAGDVAAVRRQVRIAISAALAAAVVAGGAAGAAASLGEGPPAESLNVAFWLTVAVCFKMTEAFLTGVLRGCGRMALGLWIAAGGQFVMLALASGLIALGAGLPVVAMGQAAAGLLTVLALAAALRRAAGLPLVQLSPVALRRDEWRDLTARGFPYAVANLAAVASVHLVVLVVAAAEGVAAFVLARTIANFCRQIVQQFAYAVVDEAARGLDGPAPAAAVQLFGDAVRWSCLAAGLAAGWMVWLGKPLVLLLSHGTVAADSVLLWVLAAALPATTPGVLLGVVCLFSNRGRALALAQIVFIVGLAASLPLAAWGGAAAVAAALTIVEWIASVWLLGRFADPGGALRFSSAATRGTAAGALGMALSAGVGGGLAQLIALDGLANMAFFSVAWAGVCLPAALTALTAAERRWVLAKCVRLIGGRQGGDV